MDQQTPVFDREWQVTYNQPMLPESSLMRSSSPEIALNGICVTFGTVTALDDVSISLHSGERHAIIGENGAGKSTLMKVLFGIIAPDGGTVSFDSTPFLPQSPASAIQAGVGMVQQHFELIPSFTVAENILLGREASARQGLRFLPAKAEAALTELIEATGLSLNLKARVSDLSVAAQQRVEILKALYRNARVLILDEPTAVLSPSEARQLWASVRRLSQAGTTVIFITHKLDEVMENADRVSVLRRGKHILTKRTTETNAEELARAMVGDSSLTRPVSPVDLPHETGRVILSLREVSVAGARGERAVELVSLEVRAGEIVGIAGVDGSGQSELLDAVLGFRGSITGKILLEGEDIGPLSPSRRRERGIGYIPEDRHRRALVLPSTCAENLILGRHREPDFAGKAGLLRFPAIERFFQKQTTAFDVRGAFSSLPIRALSGGNQQKLVLARELSRQPRLLIAAQPTRGLDFAATAFVHRTLLKERERGAAILLQSLDLQEVRTLSDRVAVLYEGRIVALLDRSEATEERLGAAMTGAQTLA